MAPSSSSPSWFIALLTFVISLTVYSLTLAPTITLEYSGQLIVAADQLGVARPHGYPIWTLLAHAFSRVFGFAEYRGYPNPAWGVNFMSAFFGALSASMIALLVSREAKRLSVPYGHLFACSAALMFALCPTVWSQALIAETHTLTTFYLLMFLCLLIHWKEQPSREMMYSLVFLLGFGLSIATTLVLLFPIAFFTAFFVSKKSAIKIIAASCWLAGFIFLEFQFGPSSPQRAALILCGAFTIPILLCLIPTLRQQSILILLMLIGLIPYIYLPIASSLNPPMDMGNAGSWEGFWHVLSRGQYERFRITTQWDTFAPQLHLLFRFITDNVSPALLWLGFIPFLAWPAIQKQTRSTLLILTLTLFLTSIALLIVLNPRLDHQSAFLTRVYFIPSFAVIAIFLGLGLVILMNALRFGDTKRGRLGACLP